MKKMGSSITEIANFLCLSWETRDSSEVRHASASYCASVRSCVLDQLLICVKQLRAESSAHEWTGQRYKIKITDEEKEEN